MINYWELENIQCVNCLEPGMDLITGLKSDKHICWCPACGTILEVHEGYPIEKTDFIVPRLNNFNN